jgi:hypothetical protein
MEIEIRANTIQIVEEIKKYIENTYKSIEIDWYLWQEGEKLKDEIFPHHRTKTIYY